MIREGRFSHVLKMFVHVGTGTIMVLFEIFLVCICFLSVTVVSL